MADMSDDFMKQKKAKIKEKLDKGDRVQNFGNVCAELIDGLYTVYLIVPNSGEPPQRVILLETKDGDEAVRLYMVEADPR